MGARRGASRREDFITLHAARGARLLALERVGRILPFDRELRQLQYGLPFVKGLYLFQVLSPVCQVTCTPSSHIEHFGFSVPNFFFVAPVDHHHLQGYSPAALPSLASTSVVVLPMHALQVFAFPQLSK